MANDMSPIRQDTAPARGQAPGAAPAVPGILLNTLPKSGSIYLVTALREGLALQQKNVSLGYFPIDLADWRTRHLAHEDKLVRNHIVGQTGGETRHRRLALARIGLHHTRDSQHFMPHPLQ